MGLLSSRGRSAHFILWADDLIPFVTLTDAFRLPIEIVVAGSAVEFFNDDAADLLANDREAERSG